MRAKLALVLAAFGLMLTSSQASLARDLVHDVNNILYDYDSPGLLGGLLGGALGTRTNVLTQSAILDGRAPLSGRYGTNGLRMLELPTVLAPAACSTAIITQYPSDLDIRREDLARRLSDLGGACTIPGGASYSAALDQVGAAEVCWRADGLLTVKESRRLYKAMDRIGRDIDGWKMNRSTSLLSGGFFGYL